MPRNLALADELEDTYIHSQEKNDEPPSYYPTLMINETGSARGEFVAMRSIEPRRFDGRGDLAGEEWLEMVVTAATANGWPIDNTLVTRAAAYLDGVAFRVYQELLRKHRVEQPTATSRRTSSGMHYTPVSWDEFTDHFKYCFPGGVSGCAALDRLMQRRQGQGESFIAYAHDKIDLCNKHDPAMTEKAKVDWIVTGARPTLKAHLQQVDVLTIKDLLGKGMKYSEATVENHAFAVPAVDALIAEENPRERQRRQKPIQCFNCNGFGHMARFCRTRRQSSRSTQQGQQQGQESINRQKNFSRASGNKCFECGKTGHFARDCRSKQNRLNE